MQQKCLVPYLVSGGSLQISSQQILPAFGTYVKDIRCYHGGSQWTVSSPWACLEPCWPSARQALSWVTGNPIMWQQCLVEKNRAPLCFLGKDISSFFSPSLELSHPSLCWAFRRPLPYQISAKSSQPLGFRGDHFPAPGGTLREARAKESMKPRPLVN